SGSGPGAIVNQDYTANDANHAADKGSVVSLYGAGGGQLDPAVTAGDVAGSNLSTIVLPVSATVNGVDAKGFYSGSAPTLVYGVDQFNVQLPSDVQTGSAKIVVKVGTSSSQANVTVFVK